MKKYLFAFSIFALAIGIVLTTNVSAQKTQKISLKWGSGEAGRAVAGKAKSSLSGDQFVDFKFHISEGRGVDIGLYAEPEDAPLTFDIIGPDGNVLFNNIGDFLDDLNEPGTYKIRVYYSKDIPNFNRATRVKFTVTVFMYV